MRNRRDKRSGLQTAVDVSVGALDALADKWGDGVSPECVQFSEELRAELVLLRSWSSGSGEDD